MQNRHLDLFMYQRDGLVDFRIRRDSNDDLVSIPTHTVLNTLLMSFVNSGVPRRFQSTSPILFTHPVIFKLS